MDLLDGAIDLHVHTSPDVIDRYQNVVDLADEALEAGMEGVVVKNHVVPTVGQAAAANHAVGSEVLHGGVVLNGAVGGVNFDAVEVALTMGGKIVWLPTVWSVEDGPRARADGHEYLRGIRVPDAGQDVEVAPGGELTETAERIIELVAEHDAVVATGHLGVEETVAVAEACEDHGARCLIQHPFARYIDGSLDVMETLVDLGAYLEFCALTLVIYDDHELADVARAIDHIGPEHCLLATDFGQVGNPPPVSGFGEFAADVVDAGVPEDTVRQLVTENPAEVLGI